MELPQDPYILLSFVNTRLRDGCPNLEELCAVLDVAPAQLTQPLAAIGYTYCPNSNRFES